MNTFKNCVFFIEPQIVHDYSDYLLILMYHANHRVSLKFFLGLYEQTLPLIRPGRKRERETESRGMLHERI